MSTLNAKKKKKRNRKPSQTIKNEGIQKKTRFHCEALLTLKAEKLGVGKISNCWDNPGRHPRERNLGLCRKGNQLIKQSFAGYLLCPRNCSRHEGCGDEKNKSP